MCHRIDRYSLLLNKSIMSRIDQRGVTCVTCECLYGYILCIGTLHISS